MDKGKIFKLIETITIQEMARIPSLVQLSSTDRSEIESKIPEDLKRSGIVKQIVDYLLDNNNTPTTTVEMAKAFGYKAQQPINTQVQRLKSAGILQDKGLKFAKKEKPVTTSRSQHQTDTFTNSTDEDKLSYIVKHLKQEINIPEMFINWFKEKHGEDSYQKLEDIIKKWHFAKSKEELTIAKQELKQFISGLGYKVKGNTESPKLEPEPEEFDGENDEEDENQSGGDEFGGVFEKRNPQVAPSKPKPGVKEPPIKEPSKPTRRRPLNPPDPDTVPYIKPKNENKGMLKKIVDRYSKLK